MAKTSIKIPSPEIYFSGEIDSDELVKVESDLEILAKELFVADYDKLIRLKYTVCRREINVEVDGNGKVTNYTVEDFMLTSENTVHSAGWRNYSPEDVRKRENLRRGLD